MIPVFQAWLCVRFIEIKSNLRRKKVHRTNQGSNFLGGQFWQYRSNLEEKVNPSMLKVDFSSRTDPSIFALIAPVLLDRSDETS